MNGQHSVLDPLLQDGPGSPSPNFRPGLRNTPLLLLDAQPRLLDVATSAYTPWTNGGPYPLPMASAPFSFADITHLMLQVERDNYSTNDDIVIASVLIGTRYVEVIESPAGELIIASGGEKVVGSIGESPNVVTLIEPSEQDGRTTLDVTARNADTLAGITLTIEADTTQGRVVVGGPIVDGNDGPGRRRRGSIYIDCQHHSSNQPLDRLSSGVRRVARRLSDWA